LALGSHGFDGGDRVAPCHHVGQTLLGIGGRQFVAEVGPMAPQVPDPSVQQGS